MALLGMSEAMLGMQKMKGIKAAKFDAKKTIVDEFLKCLDGAAQVSAK